MSDDKKCPICGETLEAWAEMDDAGAKSFSAKCTYCTTYILPAGMLDAVSKVEGDAKWLLSGTVHAKFDETHEAVVITQELIDGVLAAL